jgi:hypothetical protein
MLEHRYCVAVRTADLAIVDRVSGWSPNWALVVVGTADAPAGELNQVEQNLERPRNCAHIHRWAQC